MSVSRRSSKSSSVSSDDYTTTVSAVATVPPPAGSPAAAGRRLSDGGDVDAVPVDWNRPGTSVYLAATAAELPFCSHPRIVVGIYRGETVETVLMVHRTAATPDATKYVGKIVGPLAARGLQVPRVKEAGRDIITPILSMAQFSVNGRATGLPVASLGHEPEYGLGGRFASSPSFVSSVQCGFVAATQAGGVGTVVSFDRDALVVWREALQACCKALPQRDVYDVATPAHSRFVVLGSWPQLVLLAPLHNDDGHHAAVAESKYTVV